MRDRDDVQNACNVRASGRRRALPLGTVLGILVAIATVCSLDSFPPLGLIWRHGFSQASGPTGRSKEIDGLTFYEFAPGYHVVGSHHGCKHPSLVDRLLSRARAGEGELVERPAAGCPVQHIEFAEPLWISQPAIAGGAAQRITWGEASRLVERTSDRLGVEVRLPTGSELEYVFLTGATSGFVAEGAEWVNEMRPFPAPEVLEISTGVAMHLDTLSIPEFDSWVEANTRVARGGAESGCTRTSAAWRRRYWVGSRLQCRFVLSATSERNAPIPERHSSAR